MPGEEGEIIIDNGGAGGGGDAEVIDSEIDDSEIEGSEGSDEGGDEGDDDAAGERGGDEDRDAARRPTDAGALRKALRSLTQSNPDLAKQFPRLEKDLTSALFSRGQIEQLGGVRAVSELVERIEARGGMEKIEEDFADLEKSRDFQQGVERGDPAALGSWAKDFPDGFKRSVLPMFEQLERLDDERAEQVGSAIMSRLFDKMGVFAGIADLGRTIQNMKADDPAKADAVRHFNELARFVQQAKALGGRAQKDPYASRSAELDAREQTIHEKDREAFQGAVKAEVGTQTLREMNRQLSAQLREMKVFKVPGRTANRMRANIAAEVKRQLSADPSYQREYERIAKSGDRSRAIQFVVKSSGRKMAAAIKAVLPDFNLKATGRPGGARRFAPSRGGGGGSDRGGSGNGAASVSGRPKTGDVDFTRTDKSYWIGHVSSGFKQPGQAYGKDGKLYKW
jgi:hypothetical protein